MLFLSWWFRHHRRRKCLRENLFLLDHRYPALCLVWQQHYGNQHDGMVLMILILSQIYILHTCTSWYLPISCFGYAHRGIAGANLWPMWRGSGSACWQFNANMVYLIWFFSHGIYFCEQEYVLSDDTVIYFIYNIFS